MTKHILPVFLADKPVAYHPLLARTCGGVLAGVFLSQILYWTPRGKLPGGWIWKTQAEMEDETGLTRSNQGTARRKLKKLGVLEEKLRGIPARLHYRINVAKLQELITLQTSLLKPCKLDCGNPANYDAETLQTIPEITSEITKENNNGCDGNIIPDDPFSSVVKYYEQNIALITQAVAEPMQVAIDEFGPEWVQDAIKIAAQNNIRKWSYIDGILSRWRANGRNDRQKQQEVKQEGGGFYV